jgi:H2-forming N5,N10-methylenetetrahydromethanopterin dehydrogenase-like enzyme
MKIAILILLFVSLISTASAIYYSQEEDRLRAALDKDKIVKSLRNHLEESESQLSMCKRTNEAYYQEVQHYQDRIEAHIAASERMEREIKILSAK